MIYFFYLFKFNDIYLFKFYQTDTINYILNNKIITKINIKK